jgi:signal transduction histidine kinase/pSer/pThr/pTyr-binding forkhead associated (FHA) protein
LVVIKGADEGKRFQLTAPVTTLGRDAANAVRLHDTEVSRRHAELREVDFGHHVIDLGSSNGTFVNNKPVQEAELHAGDHLQVGQTVLVYLAGGPDNSTTTDLADKISMISKGELEVPSAIVKTVSEGEGSRILSQPALANAWLQDALANLSVMYQASQVTSHILDTEQLLEKIMDLIFQSIQADRGCLMLKARDSQTFEPKAVRWRAGVDQQEKITISRTIMEHVLREGQGVLITDASHDKRFAPAQSIVRYGIREAICVPMKGRHETVGVVYLDTRASPQELLAQNKSSGKLTEDHLKLAIAIAHQAALAVEETRYHQAMVNAERLAAVGQTIAAISHHVKNILQGLKSGSDLLRMGIQEKNEAFLQQGWKIVEKNHTRIYDLVMDMLSYSKEREPALEPTDLNAVVRDVLELVQPRVQALGVRLQLRLDDRLPLVQADPEGIHRALLNVVGNALDALEDRQPPILAVTTGVENNGHWARINVTDSGVGIPQEKLEDIFKPFVSTKGAKGTGLGLAVSRKILREHGGDILVQSQVGKGSRFTLRLPLQAESNAALHKTMVPDDGPVPPPPSE